MLRTCALSNDNNAGKNSTDVLFRGNWDKRRGIVATIIWRTYFHLFYTVNTVIIACCLIMFITWLWHFFPLIHATYILDMAIGPRALETILKNTSLVLHSLLLFFFLRFDHLSFSYRRDILPPLDAGYT